MNQEEVRQSNPGRRWWQEGSPNRPDQNCEGLIREGDACPSCLLGELSYNGLFQLICDTCGRVAEFTVFT